MPNFIFQKQNSFYVLILIYFLKGSIDQYISINSTCEHTNEKRNFLMKVLYGYCRLSVYLYASEVDNGKVINDNDDLYTCCEDVVKWCQTHLLHYFDNDQRFVFFCFTMMLKSLLTR